MPRSFGRQAIGRQAIYADMIYAIISNMTPVLDKRCDVIQRARFGADHILPLTYNPKRAR